MADAAPVALVTGAAGNLGSAVCATLAGRGFRIAALGRDAARLRATIASLPGRHLAPIIADVTDAAACEAVVAQVLGEAGRLDAVAHTVGGFAMAPIAEATEALFERMFRLNLLSTANLLRAASVPMRSTRRGSMVAVGAMAGLKAPAQLHAYSAAKAGVLRLVESLADELKGEGVRVNAVLPGTIDTPENRAAMPRADTSRWVQPEQLAEVIAFLLSDAASGVTGALVPVTGRG